MEDRPPIDFNQMMKSAREILGPRPTIDRPAGDSLPPFLEARQTIPEPPETAATPPNIPVQTESPAEQPDQEINTQQEAPPPPAPTLVDSVEQQINILPNISLPQTPETTKTELDDILSDINQTMDELGDYANSTLPPSYTPDTLPPSVQATIRTEWERRADNLPADQRKKIDTANKAHDETLKWNRYFSHQSDIETQYTQLKERVDDARKTRNGFSASEATPVNKGRLTKEIKKAEKELNEFILENIPETMWGDYGLSSALIAENRHLVSQDSLSDSPINNFIEAQEKWREFALDQHNGPSLAKEATKLAGEATKKVLQLERERDAAIEQARLLREQAAQPSVPLSGSELDLLVQRGIKTPGTMTEGEKKIYLEHKQDREKIQQLEEKIGALEARLNKFSRPPSSPEDLADMPTWFQELYRRMQRNEPPPSTPEPVGPIPPMQPDILPDTPPIETPPRPGEQVPARQHLTSILNRAAQYFLGGALGFVTTEASAIAALTFFPQLGPWAFEAGSLAATGAWLGTEIMSEYRRFRERWPGINRLLRGAAAASIATTIANTVGVSLDSVGITNVIPEWGTIKPGQLLDNLRDVSLPIGKAAGVAAENLPNPSNLPTPDVLKHVVQPGDSILRIAEGIAGNAPTDPEVARKGLEIAFKNIDVLKTTTSDQVGNLEWLRTQNIDTLLSNKPDLNRAWQALRLIKPGMELVLP